MLLLSQDINSLFFLQKRLVNTSETTSYAQPTYPPPTNWPQAAQPPQQQQPQYGYAQGTYPPPPGPPYYSNYPTQVGSWDQANQSTIQPSDPSTGYNYHSQQSQVGSAPPPYQGYSYGQPASSGTHGYDQSYSQQAPSYGQNFSGRIPQYDQQNMYLNSGGAPPGVPSTNGTSSEGSYPSAAYQVSNSQPVANPMAGYWTYPGDPNQSLPQTGNDQSGYYQAVSGGQEQPHVAHQPVYEQGGYPLPPATYSQGITPPAPVPPQTEAQIQPQPPSGSGIETSGNGNSKGGQSLAPVPDAAHTES